MQNCFCIFYFVSKNLHINEFNKYKPNLNFDKLISNFNSKFGQSENALNFANKFKIKKKSEKIINSKL